MFSLTPITEVGSFNVQAGLPETDAAVEMAAQRQNLQFHRILKSRERAIAQDYLAVAQRGRCRLVVEGTANRPSATIEVMLVVAEGSTCNQRMRAMFMDLRAMLQPMTNNVRFPPIAYIASLSRVSTDRWLYART
jgi:uncharacterized protein YpbB